MYIKIDDIVVLKEYHYCKNNEFIVVNITEATYHLKCKKCHKLIYRTPTKFYELLNKINGETYIRVLHNKVKKELSWSEEIQQQNRRIERSVDRWNYKHTTEKDTLDYRIPGSFENGKRR